VISLDFKSELFINEKGERNDSQRYCKILHDVGIPFYHQLTEKRGIALWMQDGAPIHTSKMTQKYLAKNHVHTLDWPAQSPDLNPIENLWRIMKLRISKRREYIKSRKDIVRILKEEWDKLTPEDYKKCITSWPKRMKEVIKNKGGATHY
jgi:transposase